MAQIWLGGGIGWSALPFWATSRHEDNTVVVEAGIPESKDEPAQGEGNEGEKAARTLAALGLDDQLDAEDDSEPPEGEISSMTDVALYFLVYTS